MEWNQDVDERLEADSMDVESIWMVNAQKVQSYRPFFFFLFEMFSGLSQKGVTLEICQSPSCFWQLGERERL
jgi:hypothetical protein